MNKKQIDAFVVHKVDRFARNTEDHFSVRKILMDHGITLVEMVVDINIIIAITNNAIYMEKQLVKK
ncbi:MAG: recombinase family protein [Candidatus Thermoplasmatota archaeon]|nr:recombinase family protein [Candidatus Thermoplasmatota archaeon]